MPCVSGVLYVSYVSRASCVSHMSHMYLVCLACLICILSVLCVFGVYLSHSHFFHEASLVRPSLGLEEGSCSVLRVPHLESLQVCRHGPSPALGTTGGWGSPLLQVGRGSAPSVSASCFLSAGQDSTMQCPARRQLWGLVGWRSEVTVTLNSTSWHNSDSSCTECGPRGAGPCCQLCVSASMRGPG